MSLVRAIVISLLCYAGGYGFALGGVHVLWAVPLGLIGGFLCGRMGAQSETW